MEERIKRELTEAVLVTQSLVNNHIGDIKKTAEVVIQSYKEGGRVVMLGNGGSAADAQHIVAELVNYLYMPGRPMLDALALTVNTSVLTAIGNDIGYENLFARQIESLVTEKDVVIAISTSGNSPNVLKAIDAAKKVNAKIIGVVSRDGGFTKKVADCCILIPVISQETVTPHAEEFQAVVWHLLVSHPDLQVNQMKWESEIKPVSTKR